MKIIYISAMFDSTTYSKLFKKKTKPLHAANKYHTLFCEGLASNGAIVNAYSILPVNRENCDKKFIKIKKKKNGSYIQEFPSFVNFPGARHLMLFASSFFKVLFSPCNTLVFYDVLVVAPSYGAVLASKLSRKKCVGIVTDLPKHMGCNNKIELFLCEKIMSLADEYIFLTEQMNIEVNKRNRPFIVVEGLVDALMDKRQHASFNSVKKRVLYAGTLNKIYGIKNLCEAFIKISKPNEELHIYGDGDYVSELREIVKRHANVLYHGNRPNAEVVEEELNSMLLVNPRPTEGEYTKFSFPSKTLEYMVSGTPVLTARLEGIPNEYEPYLLFFDDKKKNGLEIALRNILDKSPEELKMFGEHAKKFALDNKNNLKQAKRVVEFCNNEK